MYIEMHISSPLMNCIQLNNAHTSDICPTTVPSIYTHKQ